MRRIDFTNGEHYHVFNRGVDQRTVFESSNNFQRFYESLYLFNDINYRDSKMTELQRATRLASAAAHEHERKPLVDILAFILLPNHFHLHLVQRENEGISKFLQKIEMGYSNHFNHQQNRKDNLFNNSFKVRHIDQEAYFTHIPRYIHLNALDLTPLNWRDGRIAEQDWPIASQFLESYPWTSHHIYAGKLQALPVVATDLVTDLFLNSDDYESFLREWSGRYELE